MPLISNKLVTNFPDQNIVKLYNFKKIATNPQRGEEGHFQKKVMGGEDLGLLKM